MSFYTKHFVLLLISSLLFWSVIPVSVSGQSTYLENHNETSNLQIFANDKNFNLLDGNTQSQDTQGPLVIQPEPTVVAVNTCNGTWVKLTSYDSPVMLKKTHADQWSNSSLPSVLSETENNRNTVIVGHNGCTTRLCNYAASSFAKLIYTQVGDDGEFCNNGILYKGKVVYSGPVSKYDTYVMEDWLWKDTVTMFTCYGNCEDASCLSTDQRWVVAFEKWQ